MVVFKIAALKMLAAILLIGCKKEAPYIDELTGIYKVSGSMTYDTILIKSLNDSLISITKIDDQTLRFIESSCDTTFTSASFMYSWERGSTICYTIPEFGNHSPDGGAIFFHNPPNGSFTFSDIYYCGNGNLGSSLNGIKVQ